MHKRLSPAYLSRRLAYERYTTARLYHRLELRLHHRTALPPVLVYQMGKVASETVAGSLANQLPERSVYHLHYLTPEGIARAAEAYRAHWRPNGNAHHVWDGEFIGERLREAADGEQWPVVTLVRDPVARNLSAFFMFLRWFELRLTLDERTSGNLSAARLDELRSLFLERFDEHGWEGHDHADAWLTGEFAPALGLDVYETPFDPERGWTMLENDRFRVVVLRLESLQDASPDAFRRLLGLERVPLQDRNRSSSSSYGAAYRDFQARIALPPGYLDRMYESRYARHFYSEEEREAFRRRWAGRDRD